MTRLGYIEDVYAASGSMVHEEGAVELVSVADERGAALDRATRELSIEVESGEFEELRDLLASARRLRWHLSASPFPALYEPRRADLVAVLLQLAERCKLMVGSETRRVLDDLALAAGAAHAGETPPLGEFLLQSLHQVVIDTRCVVVVSGTRAAAATRSWFNALSIAAPVVSDRDKARQEVFQIAYLVGSPPLFGPAAVGAPRARQLVYMFPSWIIDRKLPVTAFSEHAEGGIRPRPRLRRIGPEPHIPQRLRDTEGQLAPEPIWKQARPRLPRGTDEVHARQVLLCGGLSMMLDLEGESIRTLDPGQPAGSRVQMRPVEAVEPGSYLVLREGQTESRTLYERAYTLLGERAPRVEESQAAWKQALRRRLQEAGAAGVVRQLRTQGVRAAAQAPTWTAQTLARPQDSADFTILLRWLGLPAEPYCRHADMLRRARSQAITDIREALEAALGDADMNELRQTGILRLDLDIEGFAGIVATRVLALSPYLDVAPRSELRIPKGDESARWLE